MLTVVNTLASVQLVNTSADRNTTLATTGTDTDEKQLYLAVARALKNNSNAFLPPEPERRSATVTDAISTASGSEAAEGTNPGRSSEICQIRGLRG